MMLKRKHIPVLILSFLLMIFGLDRFMEFGILRNNNLKSSYVSRGGIDAEILFHGPCEVIWTIDPDIVSSITKKTVYNLSEVHTDFADNYLSLHLYLKNNEAPEKILLFVTPESMDDRFNTFHPYHYSGQSDLLIDEVTREMAPKYSWVKKLPLIRYTYYNRLLLFPVIQGWKHEYQEKIDPYFKNGYEEPKNMIWDNNYEDLYKLYPNGVTFEISDRRVVYLQRIIDLCQSKGIEIILYESPILKESTSFQYNRKEVLKRVEDIASSSKIDYWTFDQHPLCDQKSKFFSALNLNIEGGKEFSKVIGDSLFRIQTYIKK